MPVPPAPAAAPFAVLVLIVPTDHLEATRVLADLLPAARAAVLIVPVGKRRDAEPGLETLRRWTPLPIREAAQGEVLQPGLAYLAPPHQLLEVRPGLRCALTPEGHGPPVRPLDQLLVSLALSAGSRTLVVFLDAPDEDGLDGARALRGVGGTVLAGRPAGTSHADLPPTLTQVATLVLSRATLGHVVADLLGASRSDTRRPENAGGQAVDGPPREVHAGAHDILERMGDAHCVLDRAYRFVSVNAVAERLLGTPRDQLLGCSHWEAFPASVDAPIGQALRQVVEAGTEVHLTHHYTGEGHDLHLEVDAYPTGEGGVAIFWRDVTARVRAQEALSRSEEKYRALFTEMDEAYAVVEVLRGAAGHWTDFRFLDANPAFMQHTGMPDPVGRTATELLGTPNPRWAQLYGQVADTGEPLRVEESELTLGRLFDLNIFRLGGEGSRRVAVLFTDITARRQTEAALRESERHYRLLFESMEEGFALAELIWDEDGQPTDWRYLEVNEAWAQTGLPVSAAVGRTAREVNPQLESDWIDTYARVVQTGQPERYTAYASGLGKWFETTAFKHSENRFGVVFRDVTERERRAANQAFLVELSRDLSGARSEEELLHTAGGKLAAHLGLTCYHYVDVNEDRSEVTVRHFWHALDVPPALGTYPVDSFIEPERLSGLRAGETVIIHDVQAIRVDSPATAGLLAGAAAQKIGAYVSVPYSQDGRWSAYFAVADTQARRWTQAELELIQDVAHRLFPQIGRARAAAARAESEGRLRALIEQLPGSAVFVVNRDLRYVLAQGEALSAAGYHSGDLVGRTVAQAMPTALVSAYEAQYRQALAGEGFEDEHEAHGRAFVTRGVPLRTAGEEISSVLAVSYDITDRKRAENALRASEERQAFLLSLSDALRAQHDEASITDVAVRLLAEHLRLDRCWVSEVFGAQGYSTVGPEQVRPDLPPMSGVYALADYPETMRQLTTQPMVIQDAAADARFSPAEKELLGGLQLRALLVTPLRKQEHVIWALAGAMAESREWTVSERQLMEDVADRTWTAVERARAQGALAASEEKYRTLFDSIDEGLAILETVRDAHGELVDMVFRQVNAAYERQGGLSDVVGHSLSELLPGIEELWLDRFRQVAQTGLPLRVEDYQQDVGRWFDVYFSRVDRAGRFVAIVFNDITERRQREQQREFLLRFSDALRPEKDVDALAQRALELLSEELKLDRCYIAQYRLEEDRADFTHQTGNDRVPTLPDGIRLSDFPEAFRVVFDRTLIIDDVAAAPGLSDVDRRNMRGLGMGALVAATLRRGEERPLWCVVAVSADARHWSASEIALMEEVTERTWAAMERVQAEQTIRASGIRFRAVANLVPDLLWESGPDGFTTWYNQRWLEYTGQTFEEATGWGWTEAIHPDDREGSAQRYREAVEAGRSLRQEHRIRRHDGEYRWFVVHAFPLRDEHGTVVRVYGAATDIHHLRVKSAVLEAKVEERTHQLAEMNAELASSNQAFEAFADLSRDLALHLDPYALIRRVQEVALSLLPDGFATYYEPEEELWRLRTQVGDMRNPALQAAADAGLELGQTPSLDHPWTSGAALFQGHYDPDADGLGSLRHGAHAVATLPLLVGGRQVGVFAVALFSQRTWSGADRAVLETIVRNLGLALERGDALRALAEEREALAAFVRFTELTNDTGDVDTLARHAAGVLRAVLNVRTAVYFELEDDRWKARHISGSPAPEYERDLREGLPRSAFSFAQVTERREAMFFEPWDAAADGVLETGVYRTVARYPLFPQEHPAGVLGMAMSERSSWSEREKAVFRAVGDSFRLALERVARAQQLDRQRERVADLNAELGNLITRTAHTLDAPARRLSGLLVSGQAPELVPLRDSETLQDELRRLRGVAADLRRLARLEQQSAQKELLPLGEVFGAVRAEVAATSGAGRLAWQIGPLPIVRGDRDLLRQALEVLMTFILSDTRGARHVMVGSREVDGEVHVTVEDDGLGLTGEEAATLFDLSVRTDQRVPVLEGSGLIQVRRILARHGGWVWAEAQHTGKVVLAFPRDEAINEFEALFRQGPQDQ